MIEVEMRDWNTAATHSGKKEMESLLTL